MQIDTESVVLGLDTDIPLKSQSFSGETGTYTFNL